MKKIIAMVVLATAMSLCVIACGEKKEENAEVQAPACAESVCNDKSVTLASLCTSEGWGPDHLVNMEEWAGENCTCHCP